MKANVYIDGFNLFYGALRGRSGTRWLDLEQLCALLLPQEEIGRIRYFTAKISNRRPDDRSQQHQQVYLRALGTLPTVSIHYGQFQNTVTTMKNVEPPPEFIRVHKTEEKGSDVNLASHLLMDAFKDDAEKFVVLSNDSDLVEPLRMVKRELGKSIGLLNPHDRASRRLRQCRPDFTRNVRPSHARQCQFDECVDLPDGGRVYKPDSW